VKKTRESIRVASKAAVAGSRRNKQSGRQTLLPHQWGRKVSAAKKKQREGGGGRSKGATSMDLHFFRKRKETKGSAAGS